MSHPIAAMDICVADVFVLLEPRVTQEEDDEQVRKCGIKTI